MEYIKATSNGPVPMTPAEVAEFLAHLPEPPGVPAEVTMRQARLALHGAGMLVLVDAALLTLPDGQRQAAQIEWSYATSVRRDWWLVTAMGALLGLTPVELDNLFIKAATL